MQRCLALAARPAACSLVFVVQFEATGAVEGRRPMKRSLAVSLSLAVVTLTGVPAIRAAEPCPPEVAKATAALKSAQASLKKSPQTARAQQDIQAPRSQAGNRSQDIQAPRGNQDVQAPRVNDAAALVRQANAAARKKGDMTTAAQKAREALALLNKEAGGSIGTIKAIGSHEPRTPCSQRG